MCPNRSVGFASLNSLHVLAYPHFAVYAGIRAKNECHDSAATPVTSFASRILETVFATKSDVVLPKEMLSVYQRRKSTATLCDNLMLKLQLAVSQSAGETTPAELEAFSLPGHSASTKHEHGLLGVLF